MSNASRRKVRFLGNSFQSMTHAIIERMLTADDIPASDNMPSAAADVAKATSATTTMRRGPSILIDAFEDVRISQPLASNNSDADSFGDACALEDLEDLGADAFFNTTFSQESMKTTSSQADMATLPDHFDDTSGAKEITFRWKLINI